MSSRTTHHHSDRSARPRRRILQRLLRSLFGAAFHPERMNSPQHNFAPLEPRVLLSGDISGIAFDDLNGNGAFDDGEPALANVQVYLDADGNGVFDTGEIETTSDENGKWVIEDVDDGTYAVRQTALVGYVPTAPDANSATVNVTSADPPTLANFDTILGWGIAVDLLDGLAVVGTADERAYIVDISVPTTSGSVIELTPNPADGDFSGFGKSVARLDDYFIVGAPDADYGGAVYVFDGDGDQIARLTADDAAFWPVAPGAAFGDEFGAALAADGNFLMVGAPGANSESGAVYNFAFQSLISDGGSIYGSSNWIPGGLNPGDRFGHSVDLSSELQIAGAPGDDYGGAVYVNDPIFGFDYEITPSEVLPADGDDFGISVALDGITAIVGSIGRTVSGETRGEAYLFDAWTGDLLHTLAPLDLSDGDAAGFAVAIDSGLALMSAPGYDGGETDAGRVYVYDVETGELLDEIQAATPVADARFGSALALEDGVILVGHGPAATQPVYAYRTGIPDGHLVTVAGGDIEDLFFGQFELATISGTIWDDLAGNERFDAGDDMPVAGERVYIELEDYSDFGFGIFEWEDAGDLNGVWDEGEGDRWVYSDEFGNYSFDGLGPGAYWVAWIHSDERVQTYPNGETTFNEIADLNEWDEGSEASISPAQASLPADYPDYRVEVTSGENHDRDFGLFELGKVSGVVFADHNGNGIQDPGEPGIEGVVVFNDEDDDGTLDWDDQWQVDEETYDVNPPNGKWDAPSGSGPPEGEQWVTTDADGRWTLSYMGPGAQSIRQILPDSVVIQTGPVAINHKLMPDDLLESSEFGFDVATFGNLAIIGAPGSDSVYLFDLTTGEQLQQFAGPDDSRFGHSVALYGNLALIGAPYERDADEDPNGAAYLYNLVTGESIRIVAPEGRGGDESGIEFGHAVALSDAMLAIGAPNVDDPDGAVFIYTFFAGPVDAIHGDDFYSALPYGSDGGQPILFSTLEGFGSALSISSGYVAIGSAPNIENEEVFVVAGAGSPFAQVEILEDGTSGEAFGFSVNRDGQSTVIGAPDADGEAGAVYIGGIGFLGLAFDEMWRLTAPGGQAGDRFGHDVAHTVGHTVVGAPLAASSAGDAGAVYVFLNDDVAGPTLLALIVPDDLQSGDGFGTAVDFSGSLILGGAPGHDAGGSDAGAAYVTEVNLPAFRFNAVSGQHLQDVGFGQFTPSDISGTIFHDVDGDGLQDEGEDTYADYGDIVYLDENNNGVHDTDEPSQFLFDGTWSFSDVGPGVQRVRLITDSDEIVTTPLLDIVPVSGIDTTGHKIGRFTLTSLEVFVFDDIDGDGERDDPAEQPLDDVTVFLDLNDNGQHDDDEPFDIADIDSYGGRVAFHDLGPGPHRVRTLGLEGYFQTTDPLDVMLLSAQSASITDAIGLQEGIVISGNLFLDQNGDGDREGDASLAGWTIFLDANNNGLLDGDEIHTTTDRVGDYRFSGLPQDQTHHVRVSLPDHYVLTTPVLDVNGQEVEGEYTGGDLGVFKLANISGYVFDDLDGDSVDEQAPRLEGWTVFLDANNNGMLDGDEASTLTLADGSFHFQGLKADDYRVRLVVPADWIATTAAPAAFAATSGAHARDIRLGAFNLFDISGIAWQDSNGDGIQDDGEPVLADALVYLDADNDGRFDDGERSMLTGGGGHYAFLDNGPGTYAVRQVVPTDWQQSQPESDARRHELAKILAADGAARDQFGRGVALAGNWLIIGAADGDFRGGEAGAVYVYDVTTGQEVFKLLSPLGDADDNFGSAVAMSGDLLVVGADGSDSAGSTAGAAYLFDLTTGELIHTLLPEASTSGARFGAAVAIDGNTIAIGAYLDSEAGLGAGAGYIFDAVTGTQVAKLLPEDPAAGAFFGRDVDLSGGVVIVGASRSTELGIQSGAAYLFEAATGAQRAKLLPSEGANWDFFGTSVAISGNIAIVGAYNNDIPDAPDRTDIGAVFVFDVATGVQTGILRATDATGAEYFGASLDLDGNLAVIGAYNDSDGVNGVRSGSAYVFDVRSGRQLARLVPSDGLAHGRFGEAVAIDGELVVAGAPGDDDNGNLAGAAYLFEEGATGQAGYHFRGQSGHDQQDLDFGTYQFGSLSGQVLHDLDGDGDTADPDGPLAGRVVFLDANGSGVYEVGERFTTTDAEGVYSFEGLLPGTYQARLLLTGGWIASTANPADPDPAIITSGTHHSGVDFRAHTTGSIAGSVFEDLHADGDSLSDPALAAWTVYLDANGNDIFDLGEAAVLTDAAGTFHFDGLLPDNYSVRLVTKQGYEQSTPDPLSITLTSGQSHSGTEFGAFRRVSISGNVFEDLRGDGLKYRDPNIAGQLLYLDADGDRVLDDGEATVSTDGLGNYTFSDLLPGSYRVRMLLPAGWHQTTTDPGDVITVSGDHLGGFNFGALELGSISGRLFDDLNGNGQDDNDPGFPDVLIYLDVNLNWTLDDGEQNTLTDASGGYMFSGLLPGFYQINLIMPDGWSLTQFPNSPVQVLSGTDAEDVDFGVVEPVTLAGRVFSDTNGNGLDDAEPGLAGLAVFLDANSNGVFDEGEVAASSAEDGSYSFTDLEPGTYRVLAVGPTGQVQTTTNPPAVDALSGDTRDDLSFGYFEPMAIEGHVFEDTDADGDLAHEPALGGMTVFLDTDNDGIRGPDEAAAVTDADGRYRFEGLLPGTYRVRFEAPSGFVQTTVAPAAVVADSTGAVLDGGDFGVLEAQQVTFDQDEPLAFVDANRALITIALTGPGEVTVLLAADGLGRRVARLETIGTTAASVLSVSSSDPAVQPVLETVEITGSLGALHAITTLLDGDLRITGTIGQFILGSTQDATITLGAAGVLHILGEVHETEIDITAVGGFGVGRLLLPGFVDGLDLDSTGGVGIISAHTLRNSNLTFGPGGGHLESLTAQSLNNVSIAVAGGIFEVDIAGNWIDPDSQASPDFLSAAWIWRMNVGGLTEAGLDLSGAGAPQGFALAHFQADGVGHGQYLVSSGNVGNFFAGEIDGAVFDLGSGHLTRLLSHGNASFDLTARSATAIGILGNLHDAKLTLTSTGTALSKLIVIGGVARTELRSSGSIIEIDTGELVDSRVLVGVTPAGAASPDGLPAASASSFTTPGAAIGSIIVRSAGSQPSLLRSAIAASRIGRLTLVGHMEGDAAHTSGITADRIGRFAQWDPTTLSLVHFAEPLDTADQVTAKIGMLPENTAIRVL